MGESHSWYFSISSSLIRATILFLFLVVLCSILLRFADCLSVVSLIWFPLGDHNVVSGYLLFPSKSVYYLAS